MGRPPGVTSARGRRYEDAEVGLRSFQLDGGAELRLDAVPRPRLLILGSGCGHTADAAVRPGDVAILPAGTTARLVADPGGLHGFEVTLVGLDDVGPARVEPRVRLAPFVPEQIIAPAEGPFRLDGLSLAWVLVPPGVTTSQHVLGVDERYLMMDGPATMELDGSEHPVERGDVVHIPAGSMQRIRNPSRARPLRIPCLCTPGFDVSVYEEGPLSGHGPEGFSLHGWWEANRSEYEGNTP